ncbi:hypothetical protein [Gordonia hongkongensis]|uniref:hypothetical protein n=1 Tax=Gordonia hongkongensis TaxID=1701090 RepID=UPI003EBA85A2
MATRIEYEDFRFITAPTVRGLELNDAADPEGRFRAVRAGATRWEAEPMGAMDISSTEREQMVRLRLEFDELD